MPDVDLSDFHDLPDPEDKTYPGSTRTRRSALPKPSPEPVEALRWDRSPIRRTLLVKGRQTPMDLFHIGALAQALGKSQVTLRAWMDKRWLPEARYRDKPKKTAGGKIIAGKRMWTRAQIEYIVTTAHETGMLLGPGNSGKMDQEEFTRRIRAFLRKELES